MYRRPNHHAEATHSGTDALVTVILTIHTMSILAETTVGATIAVM